jgi:conjugal transfer pilus assembly protein TraB
MVDGDNKWNRLKSALRDRFGKSKNSGVNALNSGTKSIRLKQFLFLGGGAAVLLLGGLSLYLSAEDGSSSSSKKEKPVEKQTNSLATPLASVDERETWVNRVEKKAESVRQEADQVRQENQVLTQRVDVLEELLKQPPSAPTITPDTQPNLALSTMTPQTVTPQISPLDSGEGSQEPSPLKKIGPQRTHKIAHITGSKLGGAVIKSPDTYLPAGTYCKAVVDMGVAASTATNSQGNPEPIKLRLVDDGNLPGGLKGHVKDAVLIGACYGDISSERARCRLESITWKDKTGKHIEKSIEGWVVGEDGLAGLRGKVVDRSGEVAREAFGAGLLVAASNFLKFEATSGVYPMTPFGQTNALGKAGALKGAAASGAGNALDKLAEYSIKRAEQMTPVILVASGRVVDVLLKSGVSLTPDIDNELKVVGAKTTNTTQENHAQETQEN